MASPKQPFTTKDAGWFPDPENPKSCITLKGAKALLAEYTDEYRLLQSDESQAALTRRVELRRQMKKLSDFRLSKESLVEVDVPQHQNPRGAFVIGNRIFPPGKHTVPASVAQVLTHAIDTCRRIALEALFRNNGENFDLGNTSDRARQVRGEATE